ncbi:MAG: hypothetical protein JWP55_4550, partial [Mycobacterium sp.]|nr:hypothetical protein [Mycobacterium sp.]
MAVKVLSAEVDRISACSWVMVPSVTTSYWARTDECQLPLFPPTSPVSPPPKPGCPVIVTVFDVDDMKGARGAGVNTAV